MRTAPASPTGGALLTLCALLAAAGGTEAQERYTLNGNPAIWALAGEVQVVPGTGSEVVVMVLRHGPDADQLRIETGDLRGRSSLRVIHPSNQVVYDRGTGGRYRTTLRVRDDGTFGSGTDGGSRVRIGGAGEGIDAHVEIRVEVPTGRDAAIFVGVGSIDAAAIRGDLDLEISSGPVEVTEVVGRVHADTGSGDIRIEDVEGSVLADTGSGEIMLRGVRGPSIQGDTGSGRVVVEGSTTDRLEADTGSGDIVVSGSSVTRIVLDTGSGDIRADGISAVQRMSIDTGSGDVFVRFATGIDAEIEIDTGSGDIEVDFPVEVLRSERDYFRGRVGTGAGSISIDTGSGDIRLLGSGGATR